MDKNPHETKKTEELPTCPPSLQRSGKPLPTFPLTFGSNGDIHPLQKNDGMFYLGMETTLLII